MIKRFEIPIYKVSLWVGVSAEIDTERMKLKKYFPHIEPLGDTTAACLTYHEASFGLFFTREHLCMETIGHEVFHCTHRILDHVCANFDPTHHETAALLQGYLMDLVYRAVKRYL